MSTRDHETPNGGPDVARALREAVAALYFADSSDYYSALWSVVRALSPVTAELLEHDERTAFLSTIPEDERDDYESR